VILGAIGGLMHMKINKGVNVTCVMPLAPEHPIAKDIAKRDKKSRPTVKIESDEARDYLMGMQENERKCGGGFDRRGNESG